MFDYKSKSLLTRDKRFHDGTASVSFALTRSLLWQIAVGLFDGELPLGSADAPSDHDIGFPVDGIIPDNTVNVVSCSHDRYARDGTSSYERFRAGWLGNGKQILSAFCKSLPVLLVTFSNPEPTVCLQLQQSHARVEERTLL